MSRILPALALLACLAVVPAQAQDAGRSVPAQLASVVQCRLLSDARNARGPFTVGVEFRMAPGWHIDAKHPGDTVRAPRIRWTLPAGYRVEELPYPTPRRFSRAGVVDYGYTGKVILLAIIVPPCDTRPRHASHPVITADVDWRACKTSCLPEQATLRITIGEQSAIQLQEAERLLREARRRLRRSPSDDDERCDPSP